MVNASSLLEGAFIALPVLVVVLLLAGLRHSRRAASGTLAGPTDSGRRSAVVAGIVSVVWLGVTAAAARSGRLTFDALPPSMLMAVITGALLALTLGLSRTGERVAASVPLAALVGSQVFRLPLELAMHRAMSEGLMPVQMSYSGLNFDILTGASALLLGLILAVRPLARAWVQLWNVAGLLLLVNVVTIAILSTPLFRVFTNEPPNTWIEAFPFVWLPTVLVPAALLGHVLVWRRLRMEREQAAARSAVVIA